MRRMRTLLLATVALALITAQSYGEPDKQIPPTATKAPSANAIEFSEARIAGKRATVCRVNLQKATLELHSRDGSGQPIKTFSRLAAVLKANGKTLTFAMNAGMYHANFSPVGLFASGGRELSPLNTTNGSGNFFLKPNGVFVVTETGARVVETSEYPQIKERVVLATQSGPLLVHNDKIHPALNANSQSRFIRNGVGVPSPDVAVFVITEEPVNFHELATFFRDMLHCPNALYLDGTVSSLFSTQLKRSDARAELGTFIAIAE